MKARTLILTFILCSTSLGALATDYTAKLERLSHFKMLDTTGLAREAGWLGQGLSESKRIRMEARHLQDKISLAITKAYQEALRAEKQEQLAYESVLELLENELLNLAPESRAEVRQYSLDVLGQIIRGEKSKSGQTSSTFVKLAAETVKLRQQALEMPEAVTSDGTDKGDSAPVVDYKTTADLVKDLVSEEAGARWVSTANMTMKLGEVLSAETTFSMQIKAEFMGVELSAGPTIKFKSSFATFANVSAEGLYPVVNDMGVFDPVKRDASGNAITIRGKVQRRFMFFTCDAAERFETDYTGAGGFKVMGMGAEASVTKSYENQVTFVSRRVFLPGYVNNKQFTISAVARVCHNDFLAAKTMNGRSVRENLSTMARNVISGLRFVTQATKCASDNQCQNWYENEVISWHKSKTVPRCIMENAQEARANCRLRGGRGANCTVMKDGRRVSSGMFEYACDKGLTCQVTHEGGWFQNFSLWDDYRGECR